MTAQRVVVPEGGPEPYPQQAVPGVSRRPTTSTEKPRRSGGRPREGSPGIVCPMASQSPQQPPAAEAVLFPLQELFERLPPEIRRWLLLLRIDFAPDHSQPSTARWVATLLVANVGSLASDAILVALGTTIFPSTRGFVHFQPTDYGKLTLIGVTIACVAWPLVTRISSKPRWLFLLSAVVVTLFLWLPDLWILVHGEPVRAVGVLMLMHLAIAFITYNALVRIAPIGGPPETPWYMVNSWPRPS